jgi:hypothetical protein
MKKERYMYATNKTSQTAAHYLENFVPFSKTRSIASRHLGEYPASRLQTGLSALSDLMTAIYLDAVETPETLIPPGSIHRSKGLQETDFTAYPRLLFALGLYGKSMERNGEILLGIQSLDLSDFCTRARIKAYEPYVIVLEKFGWTYLPSQPLQFGFPSNPDLLPALIVFANACRSLTNKETNPPAEFLRADMRVLEINRKKVRRIPLEPEEAIRCLENDKEAEFIRNLDTWARSAGYKALIRCASVQKSEFIAVYRQPNAGRTLFGYRTEEGRLHMHLNFNNTTRIIPYIAQTPLPFRELYYERCTCAECHACDSGPHRIELDGSERRLCGFSYMNLPEVPVEHFETIQSLLKTQNGILNETVDCEPA